MRTSDVCAGRRESIVRAVVGSERTEFGDRIGRRGNAHATRAAAVIIFAAVQQIDVVVLTESVVFHASASTHGSVGSSDVDLARGPRRESGQLVNAAAIDRQIGNLLAGDNVADFAAIRLYGDCVGFHGDRFRRTTDRQLEVRPSTVADLQEQVFFLGMS